MNVLKMMVLGVMVFPVFGVYASEKENEKINKQVEVKELTKAEFLELVYDYEANPQEWKYKGDKPCIVDFYASWCAPCRMLSPILKEIAKEYEGKIKVYKIDVDKEKALAADFHIQSIPALLWCAPDRKPMMTNGVLSKGELKKIVEEKLLTGEKKN